MLLEIVQLGMNRMPAAGEVTTQQHQSMRRCAGVKNPFRQEAISGGLVSHKEIYLRLYCHHKEY